MGKFKGKLVSRATFDTNFPVYSLIGTRRLYRIFYLWFRPGRHQKYRPFYAPEVFNALNKIMQICYKESVEYEFKEGRSHKEYWDSQQKFSTDISEAIDECCETIRKRINTKVVE